MMTNRLDAIRRGVRAARLTRLGFAHFRSQRRFVVRSDAILGTLCRGRGRFLNAMITPTARTAIGDRSLVSKVPRSARSGSRLLPPSPAPTPGCATYSPWPTNWVWERLDVTYVTRAYLTRHGAGPPTAARAAEKPYPGIVTTNVPHEHQGALRFAWLDLDLLGRAIHEDLSDAAAYLALTVNAVWPSLPGSTRRRSGALLSGRHPASIFAGNLRGGGDGSGGSGSVVARLRSERRADALRMMTRGFQARSGSQYRCAAFRGPSTT